MTSVVLGSGAKSNSIPPATYLQRSTNLEQPLAVVPDRCSFPRWSRVLIKNLFQKCSRDDHKMTLGGLHGRGMVHSSGVGAPMVPRGQVIHHQQRCRAQQRVVPTISQLSWSGEFHMRVLRGGGGERHRGHQSVHITSMLEPLAHRSPNNDSASNKHSQGNSFIFSPRNN